jgi:hypothetical protein
LPETGNFSIVDISHLKRRIFTADPGTARQGSVSTKNVDGRKDKSF